MRILQRKLAAVELKYGKSDFEGRHYALLGLMCIYGIELLAGDLLSVTPDTKAKDHFVIADTVGEPGARAKKNITSMMPERICA